MALLQKKQYEPLTEETAVSLALELELFPEGSIINCREIGDGNLNLVFLLKHSESQKSIIIKQALPYAKVVGESWPLTLHRAVIEANALKKHGEFVPHLVPKVHLADKTLAITIMDDLSHLEIVRDTLIKGGSLPKLSGDIGEYLARTLFFTSDYALLPFEKKKLAVEFSNPELCKITEDLVFTDPFFDHETNDFEPELKPDVEAIWHNELLKSEAAKLKRSFLTEAEALIHGDLHTGSIFADKIETKVIDPEFAFYGPIGFDVGQFIANLVFQAITREESGRQEIFEMIEHTWIVFSTLFSDLLEKESNEPFVSLPACRQSILEKIFTDATGFAGCELIRRTIGLAHVEDLDGIVDKATRLESKRKALRLGTALILQRGKLEGIKQFLALVKEEAK